MAGGGAVAGHRPGGQRAAQRVPTAQICGHLRHGQKGAFCSAAADQAIPGVAELLAGKLPAVVTVRHHLVGQLLCYPRDRTRQDGVTCHHTALSRHHVRHCQHKLARRA